ncbi:MAG TPA: energy-coupling factor transporter ATPase [Tissierellia bacterium]|nr:energy-coupling factor transporter ATPase [Tissierellia bacterium]
MSIEIKGLNSYYNRGSVYQIQALKDIDLSIGQGEFVGLIGHTGSGKSTLIQHINGLLKPDEGTVTVHGVTIDKDSKNLSELRKSVGLVFQYPEYQLFEETVFKDVAFGPKNIGVADEDIERRVRDALELVDLDFEEYAERSPFELSGGEKRRVAIAGVLAMEPTILMLDEPTAGLDPKARQDLLEELVRLHERRQMTLIMISHSMDEISKVAKRIIAMKKGEIVMDKPIEEAFEDVPFLERIGLGIPSISRLFYELRQCGFDYPKNLYSLEEAKTELLRGVRHDS